MDAPTTVASVTASVRPMLSESQLALLAEHGEERTAALGDVLFRVGDERYPFIAILEGEVAILDANGAEVIRHGASGFLGEISLLSGQTVYLTAVATEPMRYIALEREQFRALLLDDAALSDLVLAGFAARREALQQRDGIGFDVIGPRAATTTRELIEFAAATGCRSPGSTPSRTNGRVRWSRGSRKTSSLSFGSRAGQTSGIPRRASCRGHWGSASSSPRRRRSTCW